MFKPIALMVVSLSLMTASVHAAPGHLKPENGSPLRLVSIEDGDDMPQLLSDGGVIGAGVYGILGAGALSWWAHSAKTELYMASALADVGLALGVTNVITFSLKSALSRARPYTFSDNYPGTGDKAYTQFQQDDANHSFPSGHTSNTAAAMFSLATSAAYHMPQFSHRTWVVSGLYGLATAGTAFVAQMRVSGGFHFYSDVFTGGFIGMVAGIIAPVLHHTFMQEPDKSSAGTISFGLSADNSGVSFSWGGQF
jgi:membrane-associated phospholipid phosphatase